MTLSEINVMINTKVNFVLIGAHHLDFQVMLVGGKTMGFSEKVRKHRLNAGTTQDDLALKLGVTCRTLQNYESGGVYPKKREIYSRLADIFHTDVDYWLTEADEPVQNVDKTYAPQTQALLSDVAKLFTEETLNDGDLDHILRSIQDAYRTAKDHSKKVREYE